MIRFRAYTKAFNSAPYSLELIGKQLECVSIFTNQLQNGKRVNGAKRNLNTNKRGTIPVFTDAVQT